jgi:hypothetical protein
LSVISIRCVIWTNRKVPLTYHDVRGTEFNWVSKGAGGRDREKGARGQGSGLGKGAG